MKRFKRTKQKRKKQKKTKVKKKKQQARARTISMPTFADYYRDILFVEMDEWSLPSPNEELWLRAKIKTLCEKSLSTQTVELLEELYQKTDDVVMRGLLAKKMYLLNHEYLQSFKEYSDRALIQLVERENLFDQWEGIFILGCFGGSRALDYLNEKLNQEKNETLISAIKRAIFKIEKGV